MKKVTRKHFWPVSLVAALAVIGLLAAVMALAGAPGAALAQTPTDPPNPFTPPTVTPTTTTTPGGTASPTAQPTATRPAVNDETDNIVKDSTSAGAGIKITLTIGNLPSDVDMQAGSSVVLYLEDDFQVPDTIARNTVFFTVTNYDGTPDGKARGRGERKTGDGGRVYVTDPIEIEEDDYFAGDDDTSIRVYLPDFNPSEDAPYDGFDGPEAGQTLTMVIAEEAGIKNPTEAHDNENDYSRAAYKASYDLLPVGGDVKGNISDTVTKKFEGMAAGADPFTDLDVKAKISLSDEDNTRGYELTVTGSGFNNGTSAAVHVLADDASNPDLAALLASDERSLCRLIIRDGQRAGIATVGSDDKVSVEFPVTVPIFRPGEKNYLCMVDGEGRLSYDDVEQFKLEPSIRVSPTNASVGDTVNVSAQDYPAEDASFTSLKIANQYVYPRSEAGDNYVPVSPNPIGSDGSATITFDLPGSVSGSPLEGTVRIDAAWTDRDGNVTSEDTKITLTGSSLRLSVGEARANESVTIQGEGFGSGRNITVDPANITIDGVQLLVDEDSLDSDGKVDVSNAGQFVATVYLWRDEDDETATDNPALIAGTHTIKVQDSAGFYGTATIIIKEPGMTITPDVLGPRDHLTVTGTDWPVDNLDSDADTGNVVVKVENREYTVIPDATGRFSVAHQVSRRVAIPSTQQVEATYQEGTTKSIVKTASFEVPAATIAIDPGQGQPGDEVSLTVAGMPVRTEVEEITIGGARVGRSQDLRTDRNGDLTAEDIAIPGLDPGTYSVIMKVGSGDTQTVAIGSIEVLPEEAPGAKAMLPEALENLGDNLVAVFYFDNVSKEWSFYDPREEFEDLNTLSEMTDGQAYWILVEEAAAEVVLNNKTYNLSCSTDGDCWNLEVW